MPHLLVFDVNETLLDLRALDPHFERFFGDASVRGAWFAQLLQASLVATLTDQYTDFATLAGAALEMIAARRGIELPAEARQQILGGVRALPPHEDVVESLARLRDAGFRLVTLTNSPPAVVEAQLASAGLAHFFERALSVDAVRRFKPAPEVYHMTARELGVGPAALRLIAAHDWDVAGAMRAGLAAAFVARPGMVLNPLYPPPDVVGRDLREVAAGIITAEQGG